MLFILKDSQQQIRMCFVTTYQNKVLNIYQIYVC